MFVLGYKVMNSRTKLYLGVAGLPVPEHNTLMYQYSDTSAPAPRVKATLVVFVKFYFCGIIVDNRLVSGMANYPASNLLSDNVPNTNLVHNKV